MFNAIAMPFGWLLMRLYEIFANYGVAIILFALVVKIILLPFQMKSKRGTMQTSRLQPRIKELEKKHGANKAKYNAEVAKLYREEKINPASGCLWGLLPFPILIALFQVIRYPITIMMGVSSELLAEGGAIYQKLASLGYEFGNATYEQIAQSQFIARNFEAFKPLAEGLKRLNYDFLGIDLGATPSWNFLWTNSAPDFETWLSGFLLFLIPILSGVMAFISSKIVAKTTPAPEGQAGGSMKIMTFLMPLMSVYFAYMVPAALGLYWTVSTVFSIVQDLWLTKRYTRIMDAEDEIKSAERKKREEEIEKKREETERKRAENATERDRNTSRKKKQITEKTQQSERAKQWEKKKSPPAEENPSRVGNRKYARGRAYDPFRYTEKRDQSGEALDEPENTKTEIADVEEDPIVDVALDVDGESQDDPNNETGEEEM